jgi:thiol-disulfide isomerase/thioredoxin
MKLILYIIIILFIPLLSYSQTAFIQVRLYDFPLDSISIEYGGNITYNPTRIYKLLKINPLGQKVATFEVPIQKETLFIRILGDQIHHKLNTSFYAQKGDSLFIEVKVDKTVKNPYHIHLSGNTKATVKNNYINDFIKRDGSLTFRYLAFSQNEFVDSLYLFIANENFILDSLEKKQEIESHFIEKRRLFLIRYRNRKKFSFAFENALVHEEKYIRFLPYFHYRWLSLDSTKNEYLLEETAKMLYIENRTKTNNFTTEIFSSDTTVQKKAFIKYFDKVPTFFEFEENYCQRMDTLIELFFKGEDKIYLKAKLVFFALEQNTKTSKLLYANFLKKYYSHQYAQELIIYMSKLYTDIKTPVKNIDINTIKLSDLEMMCLDLKGNKFNADSIRDKILVVDFWATWCGPCIQSIPFMKKLESDFNDNDLQFIYLSIDDDIEAWRKMVKKKELKGLSLYSQGGFKSSIAQYFNLEAIPYYLVIDKEGNIIYKGNSNKEELAIFLAKMRQKK